MFHFFGKDFSPDVFFVGIVLQFFGREMSRYFWVEIVLQMFILQGMSLQSFLGRILRDNFWLE